MFTHSTGCECDTPLVRTTTMIPISFLVHSFAVLPTKYCLLTTAVVRSADCTLRPQRSARQRDCGVGWPNPKRKGAESWSRVHCHSIEHTQISTHNSLEHNHPPPPCSPFRQPSQTPSNSCDVYIPSAAHLRLRPARGRIDWLGRQAASASSPLGAAPLRPGAARAPRWASRLAAGRVGAAGGAAAGAAGC